MRESARGIRRQKEGDRQIKRGGRVGDGKRMVVLNSKGRSYPDLSFWTIRRGSLGDWEKIFDLTCPCQECWESLCSSEADVPEGRRAGGGVVVCVVLCGVCVCVCVEGWIGGWMMVPLMIGVSILEGW